jgi:tetratricopeptide (TPR) repeat protein
MSVLTAGLSSPEPRVREEAFQRLCELGTREADEQALEYALERLKTDPPSGSIHQFLFRIRDQRAVPLLIPYLDGPEGIRRSVIELLAQIGDQSVAGEIARRYPDFSDSERVVALQALQAFESPLGKPLAIESLRSDDVTLVQRSVGYLQVDGGDDVVAALEAALHGMRFGLGNAGDHFICSGLGTIGTSAARRVLLEARRSKEETTRRAAQQGLQVLWNQSPARELVALAEADLLLARRLSEPVAGEANLPDNEPRSPAQRQELLAQRLSAAAETLRMAERVDPQFPELALRHGELRLLQGDPDQAIQQFRRAIELNDEFTEAYISLGTALYNAGRFEESIAPLQYGFENDPTEQRHQWLTSQALALVRLGRLEEGVALARQHAEQFSAEPVFNYNLACVYGRAHSLLADDPAVEPDDPRLAVFAEEAVRLLEESMKQGVEAQTQEPDMMAYLRSDPDLASLHSVAAFRKFAELDAAPPAAGEPEAPRP